MTQALAPKPLATLAEAQFRLRQANARASVSQGKVDLARAEAALRPWALLARHFGAELPELAGHSDICPRARAVAVLITARDAALDRDDYEAAAPLIALAVPFGCPPYVPPSLRTAHPEPVEGPKLEIAA